MLFQIIPEGGVWPTGPQGPQGEQGPVGPAGPEGPAGPPGTGSISPKRLATDQETSPSLRYGSASLACGSKWLVDTQRDIWETDTGVLCSGLAWPATDFVSRNIDPDTFRNIAAFTADTSEQDDTQVAAQGARWIGSIANSATGLLTRHKEYGKDRKWEVWNVYNQKPVVLKVGCWPPDNAACIAMGMCSEYPQGPQPGAPIRWHLSGLEKWQLFIGDLLVKGTVFTGLPSLVEMQYSQGAFCNSLPSETSYANGVGWNVDVGTVVQVGNQKGVFPDPTVNHPIGVWGGHNEDARYTAEGRTEHAYADVADAVGVNVVRPMLKGVRGSVIVGGGEDRPGYPKERGHLLRVEYLA